ncbi:hypothetical protein E8A73_004950 [Polyangium aurulentum]|nr:hypothetical protein E8A73_004950 [Polyangium aurulentum]
MTTKAERVLVIGVVAEVNRQVVDGLKALGFSAVGSIAPSTAATDFHARDFDLIAMGGGVDAATRRRLREAFEEQNKDVLLLDGFAPVAVQQIAWTLRGSRDGGSHASDFSVEDRGEKLEARVTTRRDCRLRLDVYRSRGTNQWDVVRVAEASVTAGAHGFEIDKEITRDALMLVLTLNEEEHLLHRLMPRP